MIYIFHLYTVNSGCFLRRHVHDGPGDGGRDLVGKNPGSGPVQGGRKRVVKTIRKPYENHRKTTGKPWENGGFMGFYGIYPLVIKHYY